MEIELKSSIWVLFSFSIFGSEGPVDAKLFPFGRTKRKADLLPFPCLFTEVDDNTIVTLQFIMN